MDAETAKLVIPGLLAITGTVAGAIVGGFWAWRIARESVSGQRAIARDNALREDLRARLAPLRERVVRRASLLRRAYGDLEWQEIARGDDEEPQVDPAELARLLEAAEDRSEFSDLDWYAAADAEIERRFRAYSAADLRCVQQLRDIRRVGLGEATYRDRDAPWTALTEATVALTRAINEAIHGGPLVAEPPAAGRSLWGRLTHRIRRGR